MWYAPFIYYINGAWVFSNQAIFKNKVEVNTGKYLFVDSDHHIMQFFQQITPGSVFFIYLVLMFLYSIFIWVDKRCFKGQDLRDTLFERDAEVAESRVHAKEALRLSRQKVDPFFTALRNFQKSALLKEESVCRNKLGIQRFSDETYHHLLEFNLKLRLQAKFTRESVG